MSMGKESTGVLGKSEALVNVKKGQIKNANIMCIVFLYHTSYIISFH